MTGQDKQVALHVSKGAAAVGITIAPKGDSFLSTRTPSGESYGELSDYVSEWNAADIAEATLRNPRPHPAGPSALAQKVYNLKVAAVEVDKTAEV